MSRIMRKFDHYYETRPLLTMMVTNSVCPLQMFRRLVWLQRWMDTDDWIDPWRCSGYSCTNTHINPREGGSEARRGDVEGYCRYRDSRARREDTFAEIQGWAYSRLDKTSSAIRLWKVCHFCAVGVYMRLDFGRLQSVNYRLTRFMGWGFLIAPLQFKWFGVLERTFPITKLSGTAPAFKRVLMDQAFFAPVGKLIQIRKIWTICTFTKCYNCGIFL